MPNATWSDVEAYSSTHFEVNLHAKLNHNHPYHVSEDLPAYVITFKQNWVISAHSNQFQAGLKHSVDSNDLQRSKIHSSEHEGISGDCHGPTAV